MTLQTRANSQVCADDEQGPPSARVEFPFLLGLTMHVFSLIINMIRYLTLTFYMGWGRG